LAFWPPLNDLRHQPSPTADGRALGQETLTHSGRPQPQNSNSGHAKPPFATRVVIFVPVLDSSEFNQGIIRAVDDYESYLIGNVNSNPNYCTDTSTNPNTQFSFYYSTNALGLEIANLAINNSNATWPTTLTGGPTVPIQGYDGNPVPALFAQGYQGTDGTHYVLITNKSGSPVPVAIEVNGSLLEESVTVSYISDASDTAANTATNQSNVQIVNNTSANPITVGPYSVTRVQW
jgi:hypothetical protein